LSPLLTEGSGVGQAGLKLNRDFTFSSSASEFLSRNGFDFGKVFRDGVPYLSRDEEIEMLEEYKHREDRKANMPDVVIATDDHRTLSFLRSARRTVAAWINNPKV
jgi:poly(A)-specific ribonuclease